MIRRLIKLLLIVGCVFADTIVVKTERKDKDGAVKTYKSESMGEYVGILDAKAYLRTPDGNLEEFNCPDVILIFDNERRPSDMINLIPQLTSKWTDYNASDLGIVMVEL